LSSMGAFKQLYVMLTLTLTLILTLILTLTLTLTLTPTLTLTLTLTRSRPNIWPRQDLPELEGAFKELGRLVVSVGQLLVGHCDRCAPLEEWKDCMSSNKGTAVQQRQCL